MSRKREPYNPLLKSYPDSEKVNAVSVGAETLFTRLLAQSDDRAHYWAEPAMVLAKLYSQRMCKGEVSALEVGAWLIQLENIDLIWSYEIGGKKYLEITDCKKSIRSDLLPDVRFPSPTPEQVDAHSARTRYGFGSSTQPNPTQESTTYSCPPLADDGIEQPGAAGSSDLAAAICRKRSKGSPDHEANERPTAADVYSEYPRKVGRRKAVKSVELAAKEIRKRPGISDPYSWLIARVRLYAASRRAVVAQHPEQAQYTPMPATWFNQGRYDDDDAEWSTAYSRGSNGRTQQRADEVSRALDEVMP